MSLKMKNKKSEREKQASKANGGCIMGDFPFFGYLSLLYKHVLHIM